VGNESSAINMIDPSLLNQHCGSSSDFKLPTMTIDSILYNIFECKNSIFGKFLTVQKQDNIPFLIYEVKIYPNPGKL